MLLSGDQIAISSGTHQVIASTVGAALRGYTVRGRQVLDGFEADEVSPGGRGQVLMPWPNRVADGRYELGGRVHQLPIDEPSLGHAIHGLVRWAEWRVEDRTAELVRFRHRLAARPGYPFPLDLVVEYRVSSAGLGVMYGATNIGDVPCPFGAGAHPYFAFSGTSIDAVQLHVPAESWLQVDARSIPQARRPVAGSDVDFRQPRAIGALQLDHAFTDLQREPEGAAGVVLRYGEDQIRIQLDRSFEYVQVYTGDTLPDRSRRRQGVAVEPMTCAPNAFNNRQGLRMLAPNESVQARWSVAVSSW
jgi:aldose 1-epimerase